MANDTAPDVREVIKRALNFNFDDFPAGTFTLDEVDGLLADRIATALAALADEGFEAAVQEYGQAKLQLGSAGIDDYHKGLVGTVYSQAEPLKAPAEEKERTLLALHAATRPVIDGAAVERAVKAIYEESPEFISEGPVGSTRIRHMTFAEFISHKPEKYQRHKKLMTLALEAALGGGGEVEE